MKRKPEGQLTKQAVEAGEEPTGEEPIDSGKDATKEVVGERTIYKAKRTLQGSAAKPTGAPLFGGFAAAIAKDKPAVADGSSSGENKLTQVPGDPEGAVEASEEVKDVGGDASAANGQKQEAVEPAGETKAATTSEPPQPPAPAGKPSESAANEESTEEKAQAGVVSEDPATRSLQEGEAGKADASSGGAELKNEAEGGNAAAKSADVDGKASDVKGTETGEAAKSTNEATDSKPVFKFGTSFSAPSGGGVAEGGNSGFFKPTQGFTFSRVAASSKPFSFPVPSLGATSQAPSEPAAPLFGNKSSEGDDTKATAAVPTQDQNISNGEEEEREEFRVRAKLYELESSPNKTQWKERGVGNLKLNVHKETKNARLIMRSEGSLRLVLNASLWKDFKLNRANEKSARFCCVGEDSQLTNYLVKFPLKEDLDKLVLAIDKWRDMKAA
mmetsp:Transcript_10548/g.32270  ORF Transcript_10548/g.32270 Transcript_10548/m.32270 type:complete len:443 (-) Transcript_10548:378-1706(-)|eukprot:CAMPEP_0198724712 /NCGR_PEP_ID=MMETSP1475-20131203/2151_1 /TAXON_ID= ORGANISM="Unidentified sp., Strain CCMP1999" /NCGR_SAMPLE_ID=MMETSP1475 /ASSEMBLY_ACC=CAM_ASM_001111 /LENGTH=442 /DNA_ID=CAMNT_0044486317 /DNA_START=164 /DNA_END=1492 /DNA_ORIENTATION=+